jgi:hypothetical protein
VPGKSKDAGQPFLKVSPIGSNAETSVSTPRSGNVGFWALRYIIILFVVHVTNKTQSNRFPFPKNENDWGSNQEELHIIG